MTFTARQASHNYSIQNPSADILRAYDIRGIYKETLTEDIAYSIGKAFATIVATRQNVLHPRIVTARDGRMSSPALSQALKDGMASAGAHVLDADLGPTPMLYFGVYHLDADAGIMLTGSHNPPSHNGFKMTAGTLPFFGEDIQELGKLIAENNLVDGQGSIADTPILDAYVERILKDFRRKDAKELTVVWDPGNGAAGEVVEKLAASLPGTHVTINTEIDGRFPNHHPDPTVPECLEQLIATVKEHEADCGIAFDGDGDRLGAVDRHGNIVWGDQLLMFFARDILSREPGATIIADVKASQLLFDDVEAHNGRPLMWKTGHSLIKAKMIEEKAAIAGEMSGHIFFSDTYYGFDDGLYSGMRLIDLLAHSDESLDEMRSALPEIHNTPEIRIDCDGERKFAIIEEIRKRVNVQAASDGDIEVNEVDGVRVRFKDGWWLIRASNTQSALIARCEAQTTETLAALKQMVNEQLRESGVPATV
jgi:phosphomannomutase